MGFLLTITWFLFCVVFFCLCDWHHVWQQRRSVERAESEIILHFSAGTEEGVQKAFAEMLEYIYIYIYNMNDNSGWKRSLMSVPSFVEYLGALL